MEVGIRLETGSVPDHFKRMTFDETPVVAIQVAWQAIDKGV